MSQYSRTHGHVLDADFGLTTTIDRNMDAKEYILDMVKRVKVKLTGTSRALLLHELHDIAFIGSTVINKKHVWSNVMTTPVDTYNTLDPLSNRIRQFKLYRVHEYYNLSLVEYLNLPRNVVESILKSCMDSEEMIKSSTNEVTKEFNKYD